MFCPKCGSELKGESSCCENCGWSYENTITIQCKDIEEENTVNKEKVHESGTMLKDEYVVQKKEEEKIVEKSKISKKFWIVTISIIVIIAIASVYCETDAYKFGKAQKAILKGDWQEAEEALSIIESYKTPKAISMRKYAEFLYSRDCFIESYAEYTGFTKADSYLAQHLDEFRTAIENLKNEEEYNYLPEKLKKQYYYYSEKMDSIDKQYEDAYSHFYDAQIVFLNDVIRNREEDYTLEEMQTNINSSENACDWLVTNLVNEEQSDDDNEFSCDLSREFIENVNWEISQSKKYIEESSQKHDMTDSLYLVEPDKTYSAYICEGLENIVTSEDMHTNASTLMYSAKAEMLAYYLENEEQ